MFANNLFNTKRIQDHRKREARNGNCVQNDDNASKARDEITQFSFRGTALNKVIYEGILIWSSKSCKGNLMEYSKRWLSCGAWTSA